MFTRCYSTSYHKTRPSYIGCHVDAKFHNFSEFVEWAELQYCFDHPKSELDKDLLIKGNKIYSPENCVFIPQEVNTLLTKTDAKRGDEPIGVTFSVSKQLYEAKMSVYGKQVSLGYFNNPVDAFNRYKQAKESHIKELASKYRDLIDPRTYLALTTYTVNITD